MDKVKNNQRRKILLNSIGLGAVSMVALPSQWYKPVVSSVVLPVHAQTSMCPELLTQTVFGPNSGGAASGTCRVNITLLSSDSNMPVNVISIDSDVAAPDTVMVDGLGETTSTDGPIITWSGLAPGANFCQDLDTVSGAPINDVQFSVTYSCDMLPGEQFNTQFSLFDALENSDFGS